MNHTIPKIKVAILGTGTAGLTSLSHCLSWLPDHCQVYSVYDPSVPILGIGESTTVNIPANLFKGTRFTLLEDDSWLDATVKKGVKYVGWRKKDWFSHILPPSYGIHFNNFKLKEFCFLRFKSLWGDKFQVIESNIQDLYSTENLATVVTSEGNYKFDYVIDCRGYPEDYQDYSVFSLAVNHCLVHQIPNAGDWDYTYHVAHRNGWMFGIPLKTRQGWGYLYNDNITDKEDAIDDISERFKTKLDLTKLREFSFKNFYANEFLDGRILKNGNRALFFEPIEALSGWFYDEVMKHFFDHLYGYTSQETCNNLLTRIAEDLRTFISYLYHGGSNYDTEFWRQTRSTCNKRVNEDKRFWAYIDAMNSLPKYERSYNRIFGIFAHNSWIDFDRHLEYNYLH
jgi:hypothetical protein